ncbi:hypothetical protein E2562_019615, partial [Oryza meyeriana var. granulata]
PPQDLINGGRGFAPGIGWRLVPEVGNWGARGGRGSTGDDPPRWREACSPLLPQASSSAGGPPLRAHERGEAQQGLAREVGMGTA